MLEFEAVYTGLPVCSLCLFFETAKLILRFLYAGKGVHEYLVEAVERIFSVMP